MSKIGRSVKNRGKRKSDEAHRRLKDSLQAGALAPGERLAGPAQEFCINFQKE